MGSVQERQLVTETAAKPRITFTQGPQSYKPSGLTIEHRALDDYPRLKVAVIGAGLSGINAAILLPVKVPGIVLTVFEKNDEVGGTWLENVYPGVRCDIPAVRPPLYRLPSESQITKIGTLPDSDTLMPPSTSPGHADMHCDAL